MHSTNLEQILVILLAAVFIVALFKRLNLSPVLGYLVAGLAIGPHGLGIVSDIEKAKYIAEFGVVFLLFHIGLELTFERMKSMRVHVFGFGSAQMILTGLVIGYIAIFFGVDTINAVIIGAGLALSSTAIVLKVLTERGEQSTQVGRLAVAVLILQDLAVVPLLVMVPILAKPNADLASAIIESILQAGVGLVVIIVLGRLLLRPLFRTIGVLKSQELFAATTLLILLSAAWATQQVGLSLALGAFLAGLLIAETEFRHQVQADILPFKSLLLGLFFMTVGMQLNFELLQEELIHILWFATLLILIKTLIIITLCKLFRINFAASLHAGLILSQGSEFAFILFGLASVVGAMSEELSQMLMVTITLTMAFTPALALLGKNLFRKFAKDKQVTNLGNPEEETRDLEGHIVVAGFGRVGKTICTLLGEEKINYIALDNDAKNVHEGRQEGFPIYYGSVDRPDVLQSIGINRAQSAIIAINDRKACKEAVITIRKMFPDMPIIARAWDRPNAKELEAVGATKARAEAFESSLQLGKAALECAGTPDHEISRVISQFRAEGYGQATPISDGPNKIPE